MDPKIGAVWTQSLDYQKHRSINTYLTFPKTASGGFFVVIRPVAPGILGKEWGNKKKCKRGQKSTNMRRKTDLNRVHENCVLLEADSVRVDFFLPWAMVTLRSGKDSQNTRENSGPNEPQHGTPAAAVARTISVRQLKQNSLLQLKLKNTET